MGTHLEETLKIADSSMDGARFLVLYDGACGVCRSSVAFLRRIDYLKQYSYLTLQDYAKQTDAKIPFEYLQESIHVIDRKMKDTTSGMKGISKLLVRSPPAFPLFLFVLILRLFAIADPLYEWISRSRFELSRMILNH